MSYVDGYVLTVPKARLDDYRAMAQKAAAVWKEHGALSYREAVGDDLQHEFGRSFVEMASAGDDDVVIFAYVEYNNREERDTILAKVMEDPRLKDECANEDKMPFDPTKMAFGGFSVIVSA